MLVAISWSCFGCLNCLCFSNKNELQASLQSAKNILVNIACQHLIICNQSALGSVCLKEGITHICQTDLCYNIYM